MNKEKLPLVYQRVELVPPQGVRDLGIIIDQPIFIHRRPLYKAQITAYQFDSVVEAPKLPVLPEEKGKIYVFSKLASAIADEIPFTGFIAVGEAIGAIEPVRSRYDRPIMLEQMRVIDIKAFLDGSEITEGYIEETHSGTHGSERLHIARERLRGRIRYAFKIQDGEIVFSIPNTSQLEEYERNRLI